MNEEGKHIGGITAFLQSLAASIRMHKPTRVVICFDGVGGSTKRRALFSDYKEHRSVKTRLNRFYDFQTVDEEQHSMAWQLKILNYLLQFIPCTVITADHVEADDVIAYLAQHVVSNEGGKAVIMSTDKDFLQLVTGTDITVWNGVKKKMYNPTMITADYGVHPTNFLMYRVISGDASDNVPGVHGFQVKTILKYFPELALDQPVSIDDILAHAQRRVDALAKPSKTLNELLASRHILERNHKLMRLDEVSMSGITKINVLEKYNAPIHELNKFMLTKCLITGKMMGAFPHLDDWIQSSFAPLIRYTGQPHE